MIETQITINKFQRFYQHLYEDQFSSFLVEIEHIDNYQLQNQLYLTLCQIIPYNKSLFILIEDEDKKFLLNQQLEYFHIQVKQPLNLKFYDHDNKLQQEFIFDQISTGFHNIQFQSFKLLINFTKQCNNQLSGSIQLNLKYKQFGINLLQPTSIINTTTNQLSSISLKQNNSVICLNQQYVNQLKDINYIFDGSKFVPFSEYSPDQYSYLDSFIEPFVFCNFNICRDNFYEKSKQQQIQCERNRSQVNDIDNLKQIRKQVSVSQNQNVSKQNQTLYSPITLKAKKIISPNNFQRKPYSKSQPQSHLYIQNESSIDNNFFKIQKQKLINSQFTFKPKILYTPSVKVNKPQTPEQTTETKISIMKQQQADKRMLRLQQLKKIITESQSQLNQLNTIESSQYQNVQQNDITTKQSELVKKIQISEFKIEQLKRMELEDLRNQFFDQQIVNQQNKSVNMNGMRQLFMTKNKKLE